MNARTDPIEMLGDEPSLADWQRDDAHGYFDACRSVLTEDVDSEGLGEGLVDFIVTGGGGESVRMVKARMKAKLDYQISTRQPWVTGWAWERINGRAEEEA